MKQIVKFTVVVLLVLASCIFIQAVARAAEKGDFSTAPRDNNGKKWRIGYYEGGEYNDYQLTLIATIKGLMEIGWIEPAEIPPQEGIQTKGLWNWLAEQAKSNYLEFPKEAYYSADWDDALREKMAPEIIDRLNGKKDLDLMIAMGTWAGKDIANDKHGTPILVLSTSDPVASGIIKSAEDSGYDNVHARVDPTRYERQLQVFNDIIPFETLGVFYEDTDAGKTYAALDKVEKIAKERGFEIVTCHTISDTPDIKVAEESVVKCLNELGEKKVEAIYVTKQNGVNPDSLPKLVGILNNYRIPSFSQSGSEEVRRGILLSISMAGFKYVGRFHAENVAKILNGAKPRDVNQVFESPPKIAINLATASIIGYDPPVDVLGAADEIYQEIEATESKAE
ncbi:MAG: ABC transporter substrate binding protein [Desulforhabdus sp.]|jgi:ABC-type uncharacterized transport system substrate-binding protein|nr:ABC transporter substrate binding protein [Desulforhabdus sp.]